MVEMSEGNNTGFLRVLSNEQIETTKKEQEKALQSQNDPLILGMVQKVRKRWDAAKDAKWSVEEKLLASLRQRKGEYHPQEQAAIEAHGGSDIFMMVTNVKCRAIEAWVREVMLPAGEKPWTIEPTPVPELPEDLEIKVGHQVYNEIQEVMQMYGGAVNITEQMVQDRLEDLREKERKERRERSILQAMKSEDKLEDELVQGNFYTTLASFIKDFSTYHSAFMKGPIVRRRLSMEWEEDIDGRMKPAVKYVFRREWDTVSPFDMYPSPSAKHLNDGYLCERMRLRSSELQTYRGVDGFDTASIDAILSLQQEGKIKDWLWTDQEVASLQDRPNELRDPEGIIDVVVYNGPVSGKELKEWGMKDKELQDALDYEVQAWLVDNYVIMARLNKHPLFHRNYYGSSFETQNNSIWGISPPELMEDCQRICNASARATVNNMAIASGPQVEVHYDRVDPSEDIEDIYPWKIWKTKSDDLGRGKEAVRFYQPNPMTDKLMAVYDVFFKQAGEQLGVPAYEHGSPSVGGAGKTAHGLSMLMSASSKIMRDAIGNIDESIIKPVLKELWLHKMLFDEDLDHQGDIEIIARASEYLIIAEQLQIRRAELLAMLNNPVDHSIIGNTGRAKILREVLRSAKLPSEDIVPDDDQLMMGSQMPGMGPGGAGPMGAPGGPGGPSAMPPEAGMTGQTFEGISDISVASGEQMGNAPLPPLPTVEKPAI
jgi:hypothetical protein